MKRRYAPSTQKPQFTAPPARILPTPAKATSRPIRSVHAAFLGLRASPIPALIPGHRRVSYSHGSWQTSSWVPETLHPATRIEVPLQVQNAHGSQHLAKLTLGPSGWPDPGLNHNKYDAGTRSRSSTSPTRGEETARGLRVWRPLIKAEDRTRIRRKRSLGPRLIRPRRL